MKHREDTNQSQNGIPALNRSYLKTKINMREAHPFLLSGFFQQMKQQGDSGLPWLRQIPILSPLFSSGQIYNNEFELIFILVPKVYEPQFS